MDTAVRQIILSEPGTYRHQSYHLEGKGRGSGYGRDRQQGNFVGWFGTTQAGRGICFSLPRPAPKCAFIQKLDEVKFVAALIRP